MTGFEIFLIVATCVHLVVFTITIIVISDFMKEIIIELIESVEEEVIPKATIIGRLFLYFTIGFLYAFRLIFVFGYWLKCLAMKPWKLICKIFHLVFVKQTVQERV